MIKCNFAALDKNRSILSKNRLTLHNFIGFGCQIPCQIPSPRPSLLSPAGGPSRTSWGAPRSRSPSSSSPPPPSATPHPGPGFGPFAGYAPGRIVIGRLVWQIGGGGAANPRTDTTERFTRARQHPLPPTQPHTHMHTGAQIHPHAGTGTGTHTENQDQQTGRVACVQKGPVADVLRDGADRVPAVLAPRGPSPHAPPPPLPPLRPRHPGPQGVPGMPWGSAGDTLDPLYCDPFPTNNRCGSPCLSPAGRWACVFDSIVGQKFDVLSAQAKVFLATYGSPGLLRKPCLVRYDQRNSTQTAQKK